ncbi:OmpA family protein [Lutibacter oricola]|uniref:OmpA family protein n=1 Tax=Lutibacter oricola TaxID=762486 RepID=UPI0015872CE0|nr:OmpA family protein [Lutibacter oricola]
MTHRNFDNCTSITNSTISGSQNNIKTANNFIIAYKNDTLFKATKGFQIKNNETSISSIDSIYKLTYFLKNKINNNYTKQLEILGYYEKNEKESIGLARANNLKKELISKGFTASLINTATKQTTIKFNKKTIAFNGIQINIKDLAPSIIDSLETIITTKILHTQLENQTLIEDAELKNYIHILKQYQKNHPTKTISITGHTDNKGYFQKNLIKGQLKADALKNYFAKQGIQMPMQSFSKGEAVPIANKYTIEGRALNNRIEIKIN